MSRDGGDAVLGGMPLNSVSRDDIARSIGYVGQSPFIIFRDDRRQHRV